MRLYDRRQSLTLPQLTSPVALQRGLVILWSCTIIWSEIGVFHQSLKHCRWPDNSAHPPNHVLIVSDARVRNPAIAPLWSSSFLTSLRNLIFKLHLKKSWNFAMRLKPHHVVFLGDMTASGRRVANDEEYRLYYETFRASFPVHDQNLTVHYLPGNNDVGLNMEPTQSKIARRRYLKNFGALNQIISIQNYTLVLLDAPGLVEEDNARAAHGQHYEPVKDGPMNFIKSIEPGTSAHPIILFTHIPLSRPDTVSCGPLREKGAIRRGAGTGYQNMIGKKATAFLLEHLHPSAIFSGDDRDYCEYTHQYSPTDTVREVTVKSFSAAKDIRRPGFQLLSLVSPVSFGTSSLPAIHSDIPCFLPDQHTSIYLPLAFISIIILILGNLRQPRRQNLSLIEKESVLPISSTPAVWSSAAPLMSPLLSPVGALSPGLRTPGANSVAKTYAATPVRRVFSRVPSPSPPSPPWTALTIGEAHDELYPVQYATRRDEPASQFLTAGHYDEEEQYKPPLSAFFPAPKSKDSGQYMDHGSGLPWSWSFVYGGRRRRITCPSLSGRVLTICGHAIWTFVHDLLRGKRVGNENISRDVIMDCITVHLSAFAMWGAIACWVLR